MRRTHEDFDGLFKYKLVVPVFYVICWTMMVAGPFYFDRAYQQFCVAVIFYSMIKSGLQIVSNVTSIRQLNRILARGSQKPDTDYSDATSEEINHAIVLPNYQEDVSVLCETLDILAKHEHAKTRYFIFLAMEAHEEGSGKKGDYLTEKYRYSFRNIAYTRHELQEGEARGKASNLNWCVDHMKETFERVGIPDMNTVFITSLDADTHASSLYFSEVNAQIRKRQQKKHKLIFAAPQIFTRNNFDVSIFVRVYDLMHSFFHFSSIYSCFFTFPLSNFTFSYNLYEEINGLDSCSDAVGDDFHFIEKAYWKSKGESITIPIYVPFNQLCLASKNSRLADFKSRFWQAERHSQGVADVAYNLKQIVNHPFELKNIVMVFLVFEMFTFLAVGPWCLLILSIRYMAMSEEGVSGEGWAFSWLFINIIINIINFSNNIAYFLYEKYKRTANSRIYGRTNEPLYRALEMPILLMVMVFTITVPANLSAAFSLVCLKRNFHVTKKTLVPVEEHNNVFSDRSLSALDKDPKASPEDELFSPGKGESLNKPLCRKLSEEAGSETNQDSI